MTPSGMHGVLNDAVSIYFLEATPTGAFAPVVHHIQDRDGWRGVPNSSRRPRSERGSIALLEVHRDSEAYRGGGVAQRVDFKCCCACEMCGVDPVNPDNNGLGSRAIESRSGSPAGNENARCCGPSSATDARAVAAAFH